MISNSDFSYVATAQQSRRFILTQAPLPETIGDFWHMVAQEQSQVIVCLCQFDDPNVPSPDDPFPIYWPQSADAKMTSGNVAVKCLRVESVENAIKITHLEWKHGQEKPRYLVHLHLQAEGWETGGMPTRQLMVFLDRVWEAEAEMMKANKNPGLPTPMIVHCASGTARSGQFTALAIATEAIRRVWPFSVKEILCSLQAQRYGKVILESSRCVSFKFCSCRRVSGADSSLRFGLRDRRVRQDPPADAVHAGQSGESDGLDCRRTKRSKSLVLIVRE